MQGQKVETGHDDVVEEEQEAVGDPGGNVLGDFVSDGVEPEEECECGDLYENY